MKHLWIFRVLAGLVLLTGIAVVGIFSYQAGLAQGAVGVAAPNAVMPAFQPIHGGFFPGMMLFFPFLLCALPFLFCLLILLPFRILMVGHMGHHGPFGRMHRMHFEEGAVPPPFEEWHRRSHEKKPEA